jgi:hypothetical protein
MSLLSWFEKGMTFSEYVKSMEVNRPELEKVFEGLELKEEDIQFFTKIKDQKLRMIALTADWCGDAALNVPVVQKIADISSIETRYLIRDENLELMDQYLTNGTSRSIPIFIFINEEGSEVAVWGPRALEVQNLVEELRQTLPPQDAPDFSTKQKEMFATFKSQVTSQPEYWQLVVQSVKYRLKERINLS